MNLSEVCAQTFEVLRIWRIFYLTEVLFRCGIIHDKHIVKVDFIIRKNTDFDRFEFDRRRAVTVEGINLWIISKEDLVISKLLWAPDSHSQFQLRDVRTLLRWGYDADYLQMWTERLGLNDLLEECLDE